MWMASSARSKIKAAAFAPVISGYLE